MSNKYEVYKQNEGDKVWWIEGDGVGEFLFSFDKKKIYNLFLDYPHELSVDEWKVFNEENEFWVEFFKDRNEEYLLEHYEELGEEEREDAKLSDLTFITLKNGEHVPLRDGKAVGGPLEGHDFSDAKSNVSGKYSSPYPIEEISAEGVNKPCKGFSQKGLKRHRASHGDQYADMTDEEYEKHAIEFLQKKCGDTIKGYRCKDGSVCRFNSQTGEYAKGYPGGDIKTCFFASWKTSRGKTKDDIEYARGYYERMKERESYDR